jgi:hypothetical protein
MRTTLASSILAVGLLAAGAGRRRPRVTAQ